MMFSEDQVKQKQALSELKTFLVQRMGMKYTDTLCRMIDVERDSMKPELLSDPEEVFRLQQLVIQIRSRRKKFASE